MKERSAQFNHPNPTERRFHREKQAPWNIASEKISWKSEMKVKGRRFFPSATTTIAADPNWNPYITNVIAYVCLFVRMTIVKLFNSHLYWKRPFAFVLPWTRENDELLKERTATVEFMMTLMYITSDWCLMVSNVRSRIILCVVSCVLQKF